VHTVFDLLGDREDDITYSIGWALAQSDDLVRALLKQCFTGKTGSAAAVGLQESIPGAGRTDIELLTDRVHLIVEAKRGWALPTEAQLTQYTSRFAADTTLTPTIAVVAECTQQWARSRLQDAVNGVPVRYMPWSRVATLVAQTAIATHSNSEKRLLRELHRYLKGLMTMQNVTSNLVYVVPLRSWPPLVKEGPTFVDIVVKHNRYFHPVGGGPSGWPVTPPNYLGFRFDGRLQQVRHVDSYEVSEEPGNVIHPGIGEEQGWGPDPHFFYKLGKPIVPGQDVKTGGLYGPGRHWAAIDLLLTCKTVREARDKTQMRLEAAGEE
jgi:hypothetical protein